MPNRLQDSTSPYLQQHADNPVSWWPWGDEAFAEASFRDVPVLLSVGYAACHWCHVMAHESFEDPAVAEVMNAHFVNVKVDREERPDVDAVYIAATQLLTGRAGWPTTVFCTPDGRPFHAGTYYPPRSMPGLVSFPQLLEAVHRTWTERRGDVEGMADRLTAALGGQERRAAGTGAAGGDALGLVVAAGAAPGPDLAGIMAAAVRGLAVGFDPHHGGFGGAPKFPPSTVLEFLLRHGAGAPAAAGDAAGPVAAAGQLDVAGTPAAEPDTADALELAAGTLRAMAAGGIYDQVAGGFARYAVDRAWVVPHFEKMLYDNAQLARVYLHWWRLSGAADGARVALETCDWMLAELATPEGGLASSLDADTPVADGGGRVHGVEGATYVWTPAELVAVLGPDDGEWAARLLGVTEAGSFEHGRSTLRLTRDPAAEPGGAARWAGCRARLATARADRPQPARDDKVVAAWNGLAVAALAEVGALLDRPDLVSAAGRVADLLWRVHRVDGRLRRVSRDGAVGTPGGVLEDYACLAEGLLALHAVTGDPARLAAAGDLLETVLEEFVEPGPGGGVRVYDTPRGATDARLARIRRPGDGADGPSPSGAAAAAGALLSYAALTGSSRHHEAAVGVLSGQLPTAALHPTAFGWTLAVAQALHAGPAGVAVAGEPSAERDRLHAVALAATAPGTVVQVGRPDAAGLPLLAGRTPPQGAPAAAFVCRGLHCELPTADPRQLAGRLGSRPWQVPDGEG